MYETPSAADPYTLIVPARVPVPYPDTARTRPNGRPEDTGGSYMDPDRCTYAPGSAECLAYHRAAVYSDRDPYPYADLHLYSDPAHVDPNVNVHPDGDSVLQLQRQRVDRGPVPRDVHDGGPDTGTRRRPAGTRRRGLGELEPDTGPKSCDHRDALWWTTHTLPFSDRSYTECSDCHSSVLPDPVR